MFAIAIIVIIIIKEGKKCDSVAHKTSSDHVWLCFYGFLKLLRAAEKRNWYSTNQQNAALELFVRVSNCLFPLRASRRPVPAPSAGIWIEKPPRPISNQGNKSSGLPDSKAPEKRHRAAAAQSAKWPADELVALGRKKKSKLTRNTDETQAKMDSKKTKTERGEKLWVQPSKPQNTPKLRSWNRNRQECLSHLLLRLFPLISLKT